MKYSDNYRGCLIGGAAGDALGYAVEFRTRKQILKLYGKNGITEYDLSPGIAIISDDTQMTLFTAQGLLDADTSEHYAESVQKAYLDWYHTQTENFEGNSAKRLFNIPELFRRRAPGMTCMDALSIGGNGTFKKPLNNSKGCGGVMRTAPIGLVKDLTAEQTILLGAQAAAFTHGHELGWIPAGMLSEMIRLIIQEDYDVRGAGYTALHTVRKCFSDAKSLNDFADLMTFALELSQSDIPPEEAVSQLGEGWVGEEALAIAVYCAAKFEDDFDMCLRTAVNHDGDSDSTGAIAGNILGAKVGLAGIPEKYQNHLELYDFMIQMADDLFQKG